MGTGELSGGTASDASKGATKGAVPAGGAVRANGAGGGRVQIVVDDTTCIAPEDAERLGITVVNLPIDDEGGEASTSAIGPLHLCAAYARALERSRNGGGHSGSYSGGHSGKDSAGGDASGDAGVVALHVGKGLSATYSNAVTAAAVLDRVRVVDTSLVGAGLGAAAIAAAEVACAGGDLDACVAAAESVVKRNHLWLYVPKLDALRRGGRISAGQAMLSTALSIKPVIGLQDGTLGLVAKCRTEGKVLDKLVDLASVAAQGRPAQVFLHHADALDLAEELEAMLSIELADGTSYRTVDLPPALLAHTGPGAVAVAVVTDESIGGGNGNGNGSGDGSAAETPVSAGAGFFGKRAKAAGAGGDSGSDGGADGRAEGADGADGGTKPRAAAPTVPHVGWSSGWSPAKPGAAGAAGAAGGAAGAAGGGDGSLSSGLGSGAKRAKALGVEPIDLSGDNTAASSGGQTEAGAEGAAATGAEEAAAAASAATAAGHPGPVAPLFTTVTSKLPHWSENRRVAKEKADRLAKAIADLSRRDKSDPEGAAFADDAREEAVRRAVERAENGENPANGEREGNGENSGNGTPADKGEHADNAE